MKVTPNIVRCELIGTEAAVTRSKHSGYIGTCGKVIDETKNTFTILHEGKRKVVIKDTVVFQFKFPDKTIVEIDGKLLVGRPENRLKKYIKRLW